MPMESSSEEAVSNLSTELKALNPESFPALHALGESELFRLSGGVPDHVDIVSDAPVKVRAKIGIPPYGMYPGVNFAGRLLGPGGQTLRSIQEATKTRMAILGTGSVRNEDKEKELMASGNMKYLHLKQKLHLQIDSIAPPAEAYYRISYAVAEVRKVMMPEDGTTPVSNWQPEVTDFSVQQQAVPDTSTFTPRGGRGGRPFNRGNVKSPNSFRGTPNWGPRGGANGNVQAMPPPAVPQMYQSPPTGGFPAAPAFNNGFQNNNFDQYGAGYGQDANWGSAPPNNTRGRGRAHPYARPGMNPAQQ